MQYDVYVVEIDVKDFGSITARLDARSAPITVKNFIKLAESGFYEGVGFHRAAKGFVIQGGDPTGTGGGGSDEQIYGEFSKNGYDGNAIKHVAGVISMARSNDMNSASSQFFITIGDARNSLDGLYAGFGYIDDEDMEIVNDIAEYMLEHVTGEVIKNLDLQPKINSVKVVGKYNID
ncbi:MAG: peptidylprolyl isomerase [Clostridia bacterium]|nr:peptidylprolyl isomerase [Clostridia bacterium]